MILKTCGTIPGVEDDRTTIGRSKEDEIGQGRVMHTLW